MAELFAELKAADASKNQVVADDVERRIKALRGESHTAKSWTGNVEKVITRGESIEVVATWQNMKFTIAIPANAGSSFAKTLQVGSAIEFDGILGRESSLSDRGGARQPEFDFIPTRVVAGGQSIVLPASLSAAYQAKRDASAIATADEHSTIRECMAALRKQAETRSINQASRIDIGAFKATGPYEYSVKLRLTPATPHYQSSIVTCNTKFTGPVGGRSLQNIYLAQD